MALDLWTADSAALVTVCFSNLPGLLSCWPMRGLDARMHVETKHAVRHLLHTAALSENLELRGGRGQTQGMFKIGDGSGPLAALKRNRSGKRFQQGIKRMAPQIDAHEDDREGGAKKTGKLLRERLKWHNPHVAGRKLSLRQARVLRASRDVTLACQASVRHPSTSFGSHSLAVKFFRYSTTASAQLSLNLSCKSA